jgi:delta(3,5)-delta(2,4)-dienoyl-CoA isomerase
MSQYTKYKHFIIDSPAENVIHVQINRPEKLNAFYEAMWIEVGQIFDQLSHDSDVRAVIFSGAGEKAFTAGLDVEKAAQGTLQSGTKGDVARKAINIRRHVVEFQDCISSIERCEKRMYCRRST